MSRETSSKISSSCSDSVSFPNTRMQSTKSLEMGSKVFRFQPVRSDVLLKQLLELENEEDSPKAEKSPKHKTSHIMSHRRHTNNDSGSSSDDDSNILDRTIIEDETVVNNKDLVPGVSWLDTPTNRKPLKIISKAVPSTPMFNKLSIKDQSSFKKECRPSSLDRYNGDNLLQTPSSHSNTFKTPFCKNSKIVSTNSTSRKIQPTESEISNNNFMPSKRKQLELGTPKQNKIIETPRHNSILDVAIRKNFITPRSTLPPIKDDKIINNIKKSDIILREKNLNIAGEQKNKETIEDKPAINPLNKPTEIKQPVIKQSSFEQKPLVKQLSTGDLKQPNNETKPNRHSNEEKQPNYPKNVVATIPAKSLQESTFQQLKVRGKDYIVINKIGEGGSGQVYRCLEQDTLQDRAIKVVNLNVDAATVNSYINEVKMLKDLQGNDRVIRMYEYEKVNQNLFVVMERGDVDFSIFLRNITNEPQIQTHVIVCYWIEMLKCVCEIHKKGIIHSDLKPSNFLIVGGRLKLIDFGIASRLTADMTSVIKNVTVGTFNYISPEALLDSRESPTDEKPQLRISYKSDVWSLGCILYQMVYKKTPFQAVGNMYAKFAMITDKNHKIEYQQIPRVPLYLFDMIKKCLVYDMRSRPTVEELLNMYYNGNYC